jgi:hypothetical protein
MLGSSMRKEEDKGCNNCKYSVESRQDICLSCSRYGIPRTDMWQPAERSRYGFKSSETPESNEMRVLQDLILRISGYHAIGVQTDVLVRKAGEMGIPEFRARHLIDKLIEQGTVIKPLEGFLKPAQNVIQSR